MSAGALVPPKPRMSGATTWKPAAASAGIWWRQEYDSSGQPWQSTTRGPLPSSRTKSSMPLDATVRVDDIVFPPRFSNLLPAKDRGLREAPQSGEYAQNHVLFAPLAAVRTRFSRRH